MSSAHDAETVKVIVRCRPLNEKEISENYERYIDNFFACFDSTFTNSALFFRIINVTPKLGAIEIQNPNKTGSREFTFDAVYDSK